MAAARASEWPMSLVGDVGAGHRLGRYTLLTPIAKGGMAMVWTAQLAGSRGFSKLVAIKVILPGLSEDPDFERMFLDEAAHASRIRHPHVVEINDLGEQDGVLYAVMEFIEGEPLSVILSRAATHGGVPMPVALRIAQGVCRGLHAAHELRDDHGELLGLVHRDVTPQNVLVSYDGFVKVADFGIAKAMGRGGATTRIGQLKGKVAYMSPEQLRGDAVDRRADVFAVGILLYALTTGRHPFRADNEGATIVNIMSERPAQPPSELVPGYPPSLQAVVMQALAKDPAKRFPTANDIVRELDLALPNTMRASTDDEVAAFVRGLVGDRIEKRRAALRIALERASRREEGGSEPGSEPRNAAIDADPESDASTGSGSGSGPGTVSGVGPAQSGGTPKPVDAPLRIAGERRPVTRGVAMAIGAALGVAALGALWVALSSSGAPNAPNASAGAESTPTKRTAQPAAVRPKPPAVSERTMSSLGPAPTAPSASSSAAASRPAVPTTTPRRAAPEKRFASPIRSPGF